jgi:hypothetical protein
MLDVPSFIKVIDTYKIFPAFLQPVVAISMVLVEVKILENLFRNINIKITALAATALHISFTLLASLTGLAGKRSTKLWMLRSFLGRPFNFYYCGRRYFYGGSLCSSFQYFTKK